MEKNHTDLTAGKTALLMMNWGKRNSSPVFKITDMQEINIKPLSVNEVWKGKRYKTDAYKVYELALLWLLPKNIQVPTGKFGVHLEFGVSSKNADFDNPTKPFIDILQKKYGFNDKNIYSCFIKKIDVEKGFEFIRFEFFEL